MSKEAYSDLFLLVRSLTKGEKRYIKVLANEERQPKFIQLMDIVAGMNSYNENKAMALLNIEKQHQIKDLKKYLNEYILRCLRSYHRESTITMKLAQQIQDIELLYKRGLLKQAYRVLNNAKKLAYEYELFPQILTILSWGKYFVTRTGSLKDSPIDYNEIVAEEQEVVEKLNNSLTYSELMSQIVTNWSKKGSPRNKKELSFFENILKHKLFSSPQQALSTRAYNLYLNGHFAFHQLQSDYKGAIQYSRKRVRLMEEKPKIFESEPTRILNIYCNHIDSCIMTSLFEEALQSNERMFLSKSLGPEITEVCNMRYFANKAEILYRMGEFENSILLTKEIDVYVNIKSGQYELERLKDFYFLISCSYFITGDLQNARLYLNKILKNDTMNPTSVGAYGLFQIIEMVYRFEYGDVVFLEYLSRSTERSLKRKEEFYDLERLVTSFIKQLILDGTSQKSKNKLKQIITELSAVFETEFANIHITTFPFISWMKSKLTGKPIRSYFH